MSVFTTTKAKDWEITCRGITGFAFGLGGVFTTYWLRSKVAHVMAQFKLVCIGSGVGGGVNDSTTTPSTFPDSFDTAPSWERVRCERAFSVADLDWASGYFEQLALAVANVGAGAVRLGATAAPTAENPNWRIFTHWGYGWNTGLGVSAFGGEGRWVADFYKPYGNYVCARSVGSKVKKCALLGDSPPPIPENMVCAKSPDSNVKTCKVVR